MEHSIIVIDLNGDERISTLFEEWKDSAKSASLKLCQNVDEAELEISSISVAGMIISASEYTDELDTCLRSFQSRVACLPNFIAIICDEPMPRFLVSVFEFGVETFFSFQRAQQEMPHWIETLSETVSDESSPEANALLMSRGIKQHDNKAVVAASQAVESIAEYDYKAAYITGKAKEMQGDFAAAEKSYRAASSMNKMFRPSDSSLGETLLVNGNYGEAIAIFEKLEKSNPRDVSRKANLATAYVEAGRIEDAVALMEKGEEISNNHPKLNEAKAHLKLYEGKIKEAFALMDSIEDAGPLFASKLNDLGIKLSRSGKAKSALALYNKAHKIVREDLKYKVSLNAGLACRRAKAYELSLKYFIRSGKEFGEVFPKLRRIIDETNAVVEKIKKMNGNKAS